MNNKQKKNLLIGAGILVVLWLLFIRRKSSLSARPSTSATPSCKEGYYKKGNDSCYSNATTAKAFNGQCPFSSSHYVDGACRKRADMQWSCPAGMEQSGRTCYGNCPAGTAVYYTAQCK